MTVATQLVETQIDGVEVGIEVVRTAGTEPTSALDKASDAVAAGFEQTRATIEAVARSTVTSFARAGTAIRPDEVQVKFGLKFSVKGNVIIAGASGDATLEISLTYRPGNTTPGAEPDQPDETDRPDETGLSPQGTA